jgi:ABC-type cobalt transport system substrate-binding protein
MEIVVVVVVVVVVVMVVVMVVVVVVVLEVIHTAADGNADAHMLCSPGRYRRFLGGMMPPQHRHPFPSKRLIYCARMQVGQQLSTL